MIDDSCDCDICVRSVCSVCEQPCEESDICDSCGLSICDDCNQDDLCEDCWEERHGDFVSRCVTCDGDPAGCPDCTPGRTWTPDEVAP